MMTNLLSSSVARLRFLLVMLVMMFATTEMWGAEVTFLPNELTAVTSKDYSHTKENITIAVTASTVTAEEFRIFKNQTLTISTTNDNKITGVEITCTKENTTKYGPGCFGDYDGYSYSSYVGTWSGSANSISLKASEDQVRATTIVITYSSASSGNPVAPYTVTLVPGSGSVTDTELEEESAGAGVALPTPTICDGWTFAGWAEESIDAETTDEPTLIPAGAYSPTSDITLYAVYQRTKTTDGGGGGGDYKLVTSAPTDWSGIYLIVDGSSKNCFNGSLTSLDAGGNYTSVTISDNTITSNTTTDSYSVTISKSTTNGKYYIKTASGYYIGSTASTSSDGNELKSSTSTKYDNSISISSNNVTIKGPDHILKFFYQSRQSWRFRYYKSTTTNNVRLPQLYKKSAGGSSSTTYYHSTPDCGIIEPSVTLNLNGGKFATEPNDWTKDGDNYTKEVDGSVTLPTPTQIGYDFKGWYDAASDGTKIADGGVDYTPSEDIELYAQWNPITYTVTLNPSSGSCDNNQISGTYSEGVKLPTASPSNACTEEGWTFVGWATASVDETTTAPTTFAANQTYNPTTNIELYAVYMKQTFTLSTVYNSTTYYVGGYESSKAILTAETEKNNAMVFRIVDGQYLRCESGYISHNSTNSTNVSCYADKNNVFPWTITENTGNITFQSTKAEGNVRYLGYNYIDGNPRFAVYVESYAHNFTKTTTTTYNSNPECTPPCAMVTVTNANPSIGGFSLSINKEAVTSPIENCGQGNLTITIVPYAGYRIKDVSNTTVLSIDAYGTATATYTKNTTIDSEVTLEPREYTITLHTNGGTINSGNVSSYKCGEGAILPTDVTKDGYTFGGWYDLETFYGSAVTTIGTTETDSKEFWAKWTPAVYSITYKDQGNAAFSGKHEAGYPETHTYNTATTLKSASKDHYTFSGWYKESDCSGDAVITLGATEYTDNITLYAKWTANQYTVTFNTNGHGTAPATQTIEYGSKATKPENPKVDGYSFVNWYKDADCTEAYNFNSTITGNITLYAKWSKIINVAWVVNGQSIGSSTSFEGASFTPLAVNTIPCGTVLAGWTDAENGVYEHGTSTLYEGAQPSIPVTDDKTFYAVFADLEGAVPEMPTVIAYWSAKEITTSEMNADEGIGSMKSNIALSTESSTGKSYYKDLGQNGTTKPVITLSNLNLTTSSNVCFSFWARGSAQGNLTVKTNLSDEAIATFKLTTKEALYVLENIPTTATSIVITYEVKTGTFFFGTVKFYEAPEIYSFEKLTAENTNGWTGSDWDGYYLITNAGTKALDGNAIGEFSIQTVEDVDNKIECSITTAFHIIYNSEKHGYSVQGVGDGDYLQQGNKTITVSSTASYIPEISYNSLNGTDNYALQWNGDKCAFYASEQSAPQMYKIMSELSNPRTLCTYNIEYTNLEGATHSNPDTYTAADLPLTFTAPSAREGYTFKGWSPASLDENTRGDQTVTAQWTVNQYTVTWKLNGGQWQGGGTEDRVNNHNYGAEVTKPVDLSRTGYTFTGWSPAEIPATMPAENLEFTAQWTPTLYTVTWMLGGTAHATSTVSIENPLFTAPENPNDGDLGCCADKFMGWSSQQSPSAGDIFTKDNIPSNVTTAKTYYAVFATTAQGVGTSIADFSEVGYVNATRVTKPIILGDGEGHGDATITFALGSNVRNYPKYYTSSEAVHIYQGNTITIASTYHIKSVAFNFATGDGSNEITANAGTYADGVWTENVETPTNNLIFTIGGEVGQHRSIASITVTTGVSGSQYTNYVTKCTLSGDARLGEGTIQYANEGTAIAVNCGRLSSKNSAATLTFPDAQYLTCPITLTASNGFVLSTNKSGDAYAQTIKVTPYKEGLNSGKLKKVYVRVEAPVGFSGEMTGTITVTDGEIDATTINVSANVNCAGYTFTLTDHLGNIIGGTPISHYEGDIIEEEPAAPETDACSENYTFDGWSTSEVEYGSVAYSKVTFPYTMPAKDVTLYPVYQCNKTEDYHRVTSDLGANNWAGDYLIAAEKNGVCHFANGAAENIGVAESEKVLSVNDNIVSATEGEQYFVKLIAVDYGYILQSKSEKYNYINENDNSGLSGTGNISTAMSHPLTVAFDGGTKTVSIANMMHKNNAALQYTDFSKCFRFYTPGNQTPIYLYKKSPLYTTSLICGTIEIQENDIVVTSTKDQSVKVSVPVKLTSSYDDAVTVSGANVNSFSIITKENVPVNTDEVVNVELVYSPQAYNQLETETIILTATNGATTSFQITGRSLPETFAIVAKVGNIWYALPSQGLNSTTPPAAYPVEVDNMADPTAVTAVPTNADWSLRQVYASSGSNDRFTANGENLVFVNNASPAMALNASQTGNYLLTDAQYNNYYSTNPGLYEWTPTTTDLETYTLTNTQRTDRTLNVATNTVFGVHSDNKATTEVRFLPIQNRYTPAALQVVEWKENSVVIMYNGDPAQTASVSVNGGAAQNTTLSSAQRDIAVYELTATDLAANPTQRLSITIGTEKVILPIPYIINSETTDFALLPGSTVAARQEVAKVSDLVILKGATLTAAGAKGNPYKFRNVTVYGGGKLVIPADNGFGVNSLTLRIGGVTADGNYDYVYPEFVLNTTYDGAYTNTSGKINLDYLTTKEQYYTFVAPFAVNTQYIKYPIDIYGNNVAAANKGSFEFQYYDGKERATGTTGWRTVEEGTGGATLNPGQGYTFLGMPKKVSVNGGSSTRQKIGIHRIPMIVTAEQAMTHEKINQSAPLSVHLADKNNDSGWNLIGNPYMATIGGLTNEDIQVGKLVHTNDANGNWTGGWHWDEQTVREGQRFLVIPSNDGQSYEAVQASNATLPAFKNFFVQIGNKDANALVIPYNKPTNVLAAPARRTEEVDQDIELAIVLEQDEAHVDQMDFLINNIYTANFDRDADFTKMMNATNLNLYGVHPYDNLSFVAIDNNTARGSVAIGYQVPQAGEYTLRMSDKPYIMWDKFEALYVTDHEISPEVTTDIMSEPYRFTVANAETNYTRFTVSVILKVEEDDGGGDVGTGVDNTTNNNTPSKFIYQDKMYILRNGVIYDAMGKQVQTINK